MLKVGTQRALLGGRVTGAVATQFTVVAAAGSITAGVPQNYTVTARDAANNVVTTFTGVVVITSTDPAATLPASSTLTSGVKAFAVTLKTAGSRRVVATSGSIVGTSGAVTVSAASAAFFVVTGPDSIDGDSWPFTIEAFDAFGNRATGYNGSPVIDTDDPFDTSGFAIALTAGIVSNFWAFRSDGTFYFSATDGGITGQKTDIVSAQPGFNFHDFGPENSTRNFECEALDLSDVRDTFYTGDVQFLKVTGPGDIIVSDGEGPLTDNTFFFDTINMGNVSLTLSSTADGVYEIRAVDSNGYHSGAQSVYLGPPP